MTLRRVLLGCGLLASLLYVSMLVVVPTQWGAYSSASQTVSELSALGAPTRSLWLALGSLWSVLYFAFGSGIWLSAPTRSLRATAALIMIASLLGTVWPPMHQRQVLAAGGASLTDTLHLVWAALNGLLTLLAMGFALTASGAAFRGFSLAAMGIVLLAGAATAQASGGLEAGRPTPWIGVWERVDIAVWLLWVAGLAWTLLQGRVSHPRRRPAELA